MVGVSDLIIFILGLIEMLLVLFIPGFILHNAFARGKDYNLSFSESFFLWLTTSVAVSGLIAMFLAYFGIFSITNLLLVIIALIAIIYWTRRPLMKIPKPKFTLNSFFLILITLIAILLFFKPFEWILGGVDPGAYMNTGFHIARKGSVVINDNLLGTVSGEIEKNLYSDTQFQFLGYYILNRTTGEVVPQFLYLYPSIIAIFYSIGGLDLSLFTTPFLAILSLIAIYFVTKEIFNPRIALIALILLSTNFLLIWCARLPNSEALTRLLVFSGIYTLSLYFKTKKNFYAALSALFLGEMLVTRIDAWMLVFPIFVIPLMLRNTSDNLRSSLTFTGIFLALYLVGWYTLFYISYPYTRNIIFNFGWRLDEFIPLDLKNVELIQKIVLILPFIMLVNLIIAKKIRILSWLNKISIIILSIIFIIVLARFFLPMIFNQMTEAIGISFYHWGWLGFTLTTAGVLVIISKKVPYEKLPFLIFMLFFATELAGFVIIHRITFQSFWEYLIDLTISDRANIIPRPYISRYFSVMILPTLVILSAVFLDFLILWNKKATLILLALIAFNFFIISSPTVDLKNYVEYKGAIEAINNIGSKVEKESVIITYGGKHFSHIERLAVPLYYLKDIYVRPFGSSNTLDLLYTIEQLKELNKEIYLMGIVPSGSDVIKIDPRIASSNLSVYFTKWPLPLTFFLSWMEFGKVLFIPVNYYRTGYEKFEITLCKVEKENCKVYLSRDWYSKEEAENLKWRLISKKAEILVNSNLESYVLIKVDLASFSDTKNLKVRLNGVEIFEDQIKTERTTIKIPAKFVRGYNLLEIESDSCSEPKKILSTYVRQDGGINVSSLYAARDDRCLSFSVFELSIELLEPWSYLDVGTEMAEKYLLKGWSHKENSSNLSFVWANNLNSYLAIVLWKKEPLNLSFRCTPFSFNENVSQAIQFFFNGNYVTELNLSRGWSEYNISIPEEFAEEGINILEFRYRYAESPRDHAINDDTRKLAVAFDWLKIK